MDERLKLYLHGIYGPRRVGKGVRWLGHVKW